MQIFDSMRSNIIQLMNAVPYLEACLMLANLNHEQHHNLLKTEFMEQEVLMHSTLLFAQSLQKILCADERFVVRKHLIERIDWQRLVNEYERVWGEENGRSERQLKRIQEHALEKMGEFCAANFVDNGEIFFACVYSFDKVMNVQIS